MYDTPTLTTYQTLDRAFHHFNDRLFDNQLPAPVFLIHRKRGAHGYFWAEQFVHRETGERLDEIALNPHTMDRDLPSILSTVVHEMVHLKQQHFGKPSKGGHNREWAKMMDEVGLEPTSTGQPGGKRTGKKVTHMIVPEGPFDRACRELLEQGFDLPWFSPPPEAGERKKDLSKVKFTCPECEAKAWAKQGSQLVCGSCSQPMVSE